MVAASKDHVVQELKTVEFQPFCLENKKPLLLETKRLKSDGAKFANRGLCRTLKSRQNIWGFPKIWVPPNHPY